MVLERSKCLHMVMGQNQTGGETICNMDSDSPPCLLPNKRIGPWLTWDKRRIRGGNDPKLHLFKVVTADQQVHGLMSDGSPQREDDL